MQLVIILLHVTKGSTGYKEGRHSWILPLFSLTRWAGAPRNLPLKALCVWNTNNKNLHGQVKIAEVKTVSGNWGQQQRSLHIYTEQCEKLSISKNSSSTQSECFCFSACLDQFQTILSWKHRNDTSSNSGLQVRLKSRACSEGSTVQRAPAPSKCTRAIPTCSWKRLHHQLRNLSFHCLFGIPHLALPNWAPDQDSACCGCTVPW